MAGAFQSGFQMGQSAYQQALDNQDREQRRARESEQWALQKAALEDAAADRARQREVQSRVDALTQQLTSPNAANYQFVTTPSTGLRVPTQPADTTSFAGSEPAMSVQPETQGYGLGVGLGQGFNAAGAAAAPAGGYTNKAAPTRGAAEDILGQIAAIRGDTAGFRQAQQNKRGFEEDDLFAAKLKEYKGTPEQIDRTIPYVNGTSSSVTIGDRDKRGFVEMSVVKPDGRALFLKLSMADQATLYAAGHLMEMNPTKGLEIIKSVNKDLAAAIAADAGLNIQLTNSANDTAYKRGVLDNQDRELGIKASEAAARSRYYGALSANANKPDYMMLEDDQRNPVIVDRRSLPVKDGVVSLPTGLRIPKSRDGEIAAATRFVSQARKAFEEQNPNPTVDDEARFADSMQRQLSALGLNFSDAPAGGILPGVNLDASRKEAARRNAGAQGGSGLRLEPPPRLPERVLGVKLGTARDGSADMVTFVDQAGVQREMTVLQYIDKYKVYPTLTR